jgi:hypothetical protein
MTPASPELPERGESLWRLVSAPAIWAVHFLLCYPTAAMWCAKAAGPNGSLSGARVAIAAYTGHRPRRHRRRGLDRLDAAQLPGATRPHNFDSPADRHRFLGFAMLLLAGLSAVATVYAARAAVFIDTCR